MRRRFQIMEHQIHWQIHGAPLSVQLFFQLHAVFGKKAEKFPLKFCQWHGEVDRIHVIVFLHFFGFNPQNGYMRQEMWIFSTKNK